MNTHGWVIRNQISNVFTKQAHYTFSVFMFLRWCGRGERVRWKTAICCQPEK